MVFFSERKRKSLDLGSHCIDRDDIVSVAWIESHATHPINKRFEDLKVSSIISLTNKQKRINRLPPIPHPSPRSPHRQPRE